MGETGVEDENFTSTKNPELDAEIPVPQPDEAGEEGTGLSTDAPCLAEEEIYRSRKHVQFRGDDELVLVREIPPRSHTSSEDESSDDDEDDDGISQSESDNTESSNEDSDNSKKECNTPVVKGSCDVTKPKRKLSRSDAVVHISQSAPLGNSTAADTKLHPSSMAKVEKQSVTPRKGAKRVESASGDLSELKGEQAKRKEKGKRKVQRKPNVNSRKNEPLAVVKRTLSLPLPKKQVTIHKVPKPSGDKLTATPKQLLSNPSQRHARTEPKDSGGVTISDGINVRNPRGDNLSVGRFFSLQGFIFPSDALESLSLCSVSDDTSQDPASPMDRSRSWRKANSSNEEAITTTPSIAQLWEDFRTGP